MCGGGKRSGKEKDDLVEREMVVEGKEREELPLAVEDPRH